MSQPGTRAARAVIVVLAAALTLATVERPRGGYRAAGPLALALGTGAVSAILLIILSAVVITAVRRRRGRGTEPLRRTVTSLPVLGLAAAVVVVATLSVELWPRLSAGSTEGSQRAAFSTWQRDTVPAVLTYSNAIRFLGSTIRTADHRPPRLRAVRHHTAALSELLTALGADLRHGEATPQLRGLTATFLRAVREAHAAAVDLVAVVSLWHTLDGTLLRRPRGDVGRLLDDARHNVIHAQLRVQAFTLAANALGSRLNAQR